MSSEATIRISFPLGARFVRNPEIVFYSGYISFLKSLFCINVDKNCDSCPFSNNCRFHKMTGNQFRGYPGILMKTSYFTRLRYQKSDELQLKLFFVGNTDKFSDSCILYLQEHLNQKIAGQFFCIKDYQIEQDDDQFFDCSKITFNSPVKSLEIAELFKKQIDFYNACYCTEYKTLEIDINHADLKEQKRSGYRICGTHISLSGYIGSVSGRFSGIPAFFAEYGIGNNNCIGGGQFEIEDIIA